MFTCNDINRLDRDYGFVFLSAPRCAVSAPSVRHMCVELVEAFVPAFDIVVPSGGRLEARLGERHFRLRARIRKSNGN